MAGCADPPPAAPVPAPRPTVLSLSHPAAWLVSRLLPPGSADTALLLDPGADPAHFSPTAAQLLTARQAQLLVASGAGYEAWIDAASLPIDRLVLAADGLALVEISAQAHRHGAAAAHSHSGPDPHLWMDPARYGQQATQVASALKRLLPDRIGEIEVQALILDEELRALGAEWDGVCPLLRARPLAANHPSFTYVAERCGVTLKVIDLDPQAVPDAETLATVTAFQASSPDALLLWEAQPAGEVAGRVGGHQLILDPLEQPGPGGLYDYLGQARANVTLLKALGAP